MLTISSTCSFSRNAPPRTAIYPLSLHDALPIYWARALADEPGLSLPPREFARRAAEMAARVGLKVESLDAAEIRARDRKSTRLNSSHEWISYAVFCLKKKKRKTPCSVRSPIKAY